ncbi:unnamed protein product, partial [Brassica napus]
AAEKTLIKKKPCPLFCRPGGRCFSPLPGAVPCCRDLCTCGFISPFRLLFGALLRIWVKEGNQSLWFRLWSPWLG